MWTGRKAAGAALATLALNLGAGAQPAVAAPDCAGAPPPTRTLLSGQGTLESVIVDSKGRLFFTNEDSLLRLDSPDGQPQVLAQIPNPGGLAFDADGKLVVGFGNSAQNGSMGDLTGPAGLVKVDPDTGAQTPFASGLSMANGVVRSPAGDFFASNDFGSNIDRIHNGVTQRGWAHVQSGNGLAIDPSGQYLYVAQTFQPAAIQQVEIAHPDKVTPYISDIGEAAAGLDGMSRDPANHLFVAANGQGEVWRVDPGKPAAACVLLRGLPAFPDGPSATAPGVGKTGFPAENVYVVTFGGELLELQGVASAKASPSSAAKMRLSVRPHRVKAGTRARFVFRITTAAATRGPRLPVQGARISFAGHTARSDRYGRAHIAASLSHPGTYRGRARLQGFRRARVSVHAVG